MGLFSPQCFVLLIFLFSLRTRGNRSLRARRLSPLHLQGENRLLSAAALDSPVSDHRGCLTGSKRDPGRPRRQARPPTCAPVALPGPRSCEHGGRLPGTRSPTPGRHRKPRGREAPSPPPGPPGFLFLVLIPSNVGAALQRTRG